MSRLFFFRRRVCFLYLSNFAYTDLNNKVITTMVIGSLGDSICFHSFVALAKVVQLFIASFHNQPMYPKMCSIDIFDKLQLVG